MPFRTIDEREARKLNCLRYWGYDYRSHPVAICTPAANGVASWKTNGDAPDVDRFRPLPPLVALAPRDRRGRWRTPQAEACAGWSVVPMIYADADRARAQALGRAIQAAGVNVAATLDVKAIDADNPEDMPADVTTVKVFDAGALACANSLRRIGDGDEWRIETSDAPPLVGSKMIEVRLAPAAATPPAPAGGERAGSVVSRTLVAAACGQRNGPPREHFQARRPDVLLHREGVQPMSDILVVGAGPTGLTLACELAARRIAHRLVDAAAGPFAGSRAKGLQPRTLEVFDRFGIAETIGRRRGLRAGPP